MNILIWDFDNTLGYRMGAWAGTILELLDIYITNHGQSLTTIRPFLKTGFPWHKHHVVRQENITTKEWWDKLNPVFLSFFMSLVNVDYSLAQKLTQEVKTTYLNQAQWRLFPNSIKVLQKCNNFGFTNVMLTNNVPEIEQIFSHLAIAPYFDSIWNSAIIGAEKPNAKAFEGIIQQYGHKNIAYMIGDSIRADLEGALNLDINCILINKYDSRATYCLNRLDEIVNCFASP
jgi:putative hydrolase of the HAD superfamily